MSRPFTPDSLAARWQCSAETIRQMVHRGQLPGFRVGRMLRIPAQAVEDMECRNTGSGGSRAGSSSPGKKVGDGAGSGAHCHQQRYGCAQRHLGLELGHCVLPH